MFFCSRVDVTDKHVRTALHLGVQSGDVTVVDKLVDHHAVVDAQDEYGGTPLHTAVANGFEMVVDILLKQGAQTSAVGPNTTTLHLMAHGSHPVVVQSLVDHGAGLDARKDNERTVHHMDAADGYTTVKSVHVIEPLSNCQNLDNAPDSSSLSEFVSHLVPVFEMSLPVIDII
jgi:ankyrin repeat protein